MIEGVMGGLSGRVPYIAGVGLCLFVFVLAFDWSIGSARGQSKSERPPHSFGGKASPGLAAKFAHWRLKFQKGDEINEPERGAFRSYSSLADAGTARLVNDLGSNRLPKLTAVAKAKRYVPATDPSRGPDDKVIDKEILDVLESPQVRKLIAAQHIDAALRNLEKSLTVVNIQAVDAAFRTPGRKERFWLIKWQIEPKDADADPGYGFGGLFLKVDGEMKPLSLAGAACSDGACPDYYDVLAVGDLDGDGIDEAIVRDNVYEAEEDSLAILAWERDTLVSVHEMKFDR